MPAVILLAAALIQWSDNYWIQHWSSKWAILLAGILLWLSHQMGRRFHWSVGLAFAWTTLRALWVFGFNEYSAWSLTDVLALKSSATYGAISFVLMAVFFLLSKSRDLQSVKLGAAIICVLNSVLIIYQTGMGADPMHRGGFFGNPSMSGSLIAVTLPFLVTSPFWGLTPTPLFAVLCLHASQPLALTAVCFLALAIRDKRSWFLAGYAAVLLAGFALMTQGAEVFSSSGRTDTWRQILTWQRVNASLLVGVGSGLQEVFVPMILNRTTTVFLWAHSEVVRVMLELGVIGVAVYATVAAYAVRAAWNRSDIRAALVCWIGMSLANYPSSMAVHAFMGMALVAMAFTPRESGYRDETGLS